jgi:tetratricopeptide (TPR) repeat protein
VGFDDKYIKAYVNRMLIFYKLGDYIEALDDFNKIKELDYSIYQKYRHMEKELNYKAEIKKKEMTEEVMGKLKDVGNSFLGLFGLSTDNFKLQQGAGGGYNIQFQK